MGFKKHFNERLFFMKKLAVLLMSTLSISFANASDSSTSLQWEELSPEGPLRRFSPQDCELISPKEIRVSVNTKLNLTTYPGTITIVDITAGIDKGIDIGTVDKTKCEEPRIGVNDHYFLTEAHRDGIKFGIRYDGAEYSSQIIPCRNFDKNTSIVTDSAPLLRFNSYTVTKEGQIKDLKVGDKYELLTPLLAVRLNLLENGVIGGDSPFRGHFYMNYSYSSQPLYQYVGIELEKPQTFLNDDAVYQEVIKFTGLSVPMKAPTSGEYDFGALDRYDFHKGQLNVINQYLKLAGEKYGITLDKKDPDQCHALLNFFISKGIVQSNERVKYAQELELNLDKVDYHLALSPENEVPSDTVSGVLFPENELPSDASFTG